MTSHDKLVDIYTALGDGIYSVAVDLARGAERTGQGLGLGPPGRVAEIGYENRAMLKLSRDIIKFGASSSDSPIYKVIKSVLEEYYSHFPESVLQILAEKSGIAGAYIGGRLVIGKKLAELIAKKVAATIAASSGYKLVATRLGLSTSTSSTGIGAPIGLTMVQGLLQRASRSSHRLREKCPKLYVELKKKGDLQLVYFLVEDPMKPYISAIRVAKEHPEVLNSILAREYGEIKD